MSRPALMIAVLMSCFFRKLVVSFAPFIMGMFFRIFSSFSFFIGLLFFFQSETSLFMNSRSSISPCRYFSTDSSLDVLK